jgi:hypothetical protein
MDFERGSNPPCLVLDQGVRPFQTHRRRSAEDIVKTAQEILVEVLGAILAFAFAARLSWLVLTALRSGAARLAAGMTFAREKKLLAFWVIVAAQSVLVVILLSVGAMRLAHL